MPKPPALVEANGWNRRVRTNSSDMPGADRSPRWRRRRRSRSGAARPPVRPLASIAFWTRWASACSSAGGSAVRDQAGSPVDRTGWARRFDAATARDQRPATGRGGSVSRGRAGREPGEQLVHLLHRGLQVAIMSARNSGLSAWRSALRATSELAHQILDVVHDEGEAPVELVEAAGVGERLLAACASAI